VSSDGGGGWEIEWGGDVSDGVLHDVGQGSRQGNRALISDYEYFVGVPVLLDHGFDFPHDVGVGSAAQTLVGCDGHQHGFLDCDGRLLFVQVSFAGDDLVDGANAEELGLLESSHILLHLRGGDHLHGLCYFLDGLDGFHSDFDELQAFCSEVEAVVLKKWRECLNSVENHALY